MSEPAEWAVKITKEALKRAKTTGRTEVECIALAVIASHEAADIAATKRERERVLWLLEALKLDCGHCGDAFDNLEAAIRKGEPQ